LADLQRAVIEYKKKAEIKGNKEFERITSQEVSIQEKKRNSNEQISSDQGFIEVLNEGLPEEEIKVNIEKPREPGKKDDNLSMEVPIRKQKPYSDGPLPIDINIINTEMQKGGLFGMGRSHIVYVVRSEPCNWEVKRRFSDFTWLRQTLVKLYPGFLVKVPCFLIKT